jgi:hypothetical protein
MNKKLMKKISFHHASVLRSHLCHYVCVVWHFVSVRKATCAQYQQEMFHDIKLHDTQQLDATHFDINWTFIEITIYNHEVST